MISAPWVFVYGLCRKGTTIIYAFELVGELACRNPPAPGGLFLGIFGVFYSIATTPAGINFELIGITLFFLELAVPFVAPRS